MSKPELTTPKIVTTQDLARMRAKKVTDHILNETDELSLEVAKLGRLIIDVNVHIDDTDKKLDVLSVSTTKAFESIDKELDSFDTRISLLETTSMKSKDKKDSK